MVQVGSNGIWLEVERSGPADGEPLVLIHGVGAQLVRWPAALITGLEQAGFNVIRFDNRDIGRSSYFDHLGLPDLPAVMAAQARGEAPDLPYTLSDMAADTFGLLDALGIARAHILGVSLGGMVAQQMAITAPERVHSLALVMTQAGDGDGSGSTPAALAALTQPAPDPAVDLAGYIAHSITLNRALGSPGYPTSDAALNDYAEQSAARGHHPAGAARQMAAGRGAANRLPALGELQLPVLVIHGSDDPLIHVSRGEAIARAVQQAWMLRVNGMGHDLPDALCPLFIGAITANARRIAPLNV